jgi:hypothetical protein
MNNNMIYTLDYIEKEANTIASYWNGSDESFIDGNGDSRNEEDVQNAEELLQKIQEVKELLKALSI